MRCDEFRDRLQAALRTARLLAVHDRPEETINPTTTVRKWRVHLLPRAVAPFHAGATIDFRWDAFEAARSYACEEDLLTELLGRGAGRSTQPRLVRVDIRLRVALPYGSTTPIPAPDVWRPWVASLEERLDDALTKKRRRRDAIDGWRGDLEIEGCTSADGASADARSDELATRFRGAVDAWTASVGGLVRWLRCAPGPRRPSSGRGRRPFPDDGGAGPETTH